MIQGLYTAANGMSAIEDRQDTIANNIANASTAGFKSQSPIQLGFYEMFSNKLRQSGHYDMSSAPGGGVKVVETYTNLASGVLRTTNNPLQVALQGSGYFAVETPRGERYTRSGDFTVDTQGRLCTADGYAVLDASGQPIDARGSNVNIDQEGRVQVDSQTSGQLRIVEFENPERLQREGNSLYAASDEVRQKSASAANTRVLQSSLEMSNVNIPHEMIMLSMGMRAYEANQRVMQAFNDTMGKLIEQVGMPA